MVSIKVIVSPYFRSVICIKNRELHNPHGPALVTLEGTKQWWLNEKKHRTNGPAVIWFNGSVEYWVDGEEITEEEFNKLKESP